MEVTNTIGRRKTSVARLFMTPGKGEVKINNRELKEYFPFEIYQTIVKQPLVLVEEDGNFDFKVNVGGGGYKGQAEAIRLAISR
ncbi:30S ribosomal protein S9, partial [Reichenbachiella sp.]